MDRPVEPGVSEKKKRPFDRITLNEESLKKLNEWLAQIESQNHGININRNGLINWWLQDLPAQLTTKQLKDLEEAYLDPVKLAKEALREARAAKARGEKFVFKMAFNKSSPSVQPKRVYKKRAPEVELPLSLKEQRVLEENNDSKEGS